MHIGPRGGEAVQPRDQPQAGKARRGGHDHRLGALFTPDLVADLMQVGEHRADHLQQALPLVGPAQCAVQAPEQREAVVFLQRSDLAAHHRLGQRQFIAGLRETQVARGSLEGFELGQRRQVVVAHQGRPMESH